MFSCFFFIYEIKLRFVFLVCWQFVTILLPYVYVHSYCYCLKIQYQLATQSVLIFVCFLIILRTTRRQLLAVRVLTRYTYSRGEQTIGPPILSTANFK